MYSTDHSVELNDFKILKDLILKNLPESKGKYFLCYRSLLYLLKFNLNNYDKNFLDLCFYDPKATTHHAISNIHYVLGYSQLDILLSNLTQQNADLSYEFNIFYGFYKVSYRSASIFLFLFIKASATYLEFESISRFGILYTQFNQIVKSHFLPMQDLNARPKVSFLNNIPSYMVDEMIYKVNITQDFVYMPVDPFNLLMYFYPNNWHFPLDDQKFNYLNE
ncbi:hypothetical protein BpHYR1_028230 [Brachionus plicatilis]|uniref:Uncharacterized protein n=1 Tax=Brachionus plicatilis TaxID=10195 RepID=A0A3M7R605_BRAPC|nr:hypothetical protein BpHYR1_028230 [Brachionus plicatilis]